MGEKKFFFDSPIILISCKFFVTSYNNIEINHPNFEDLISLHETNYPKTFERKGADTRRDREIVLKTR